MDLLPNSDMIIRTRSVEQALAPLAAQVSVLVMNDGGANFNINTPMQNNTPVHQFKNSPTLSPSSKIKIAKGKSKRAYVLVATVEHAVRNFVSKGEEIARENEDMREEMIQAVQNVRVAGGALHASAQHFADNPIAAERRSVMVNDARQLLSTVTRLLIVADMIDVNKLMRTLRAVEHNIEGMRNAESHEALVDKYREYGINVEKLGHEAARRQYELIDPQLQDDMAAARAQLTRNRDILLTSSSAYVRHPEVLHAKENRDFALQQVSDAITTIEDAARGIAPATMITTNTAGVAKSLSHATGIVGGIGSYGTAGALAAAVAAGGGDSVELAAALDEFDENVAMSPHYLQHMHAMRDMLERQLESIIASAALVADMSSSSAAAPPGTMMPVMTRGDGGDRRRQRIIAECQALRNALQELLTEFMRNSKRKQPDHASRAALERAIAGMMQRTRQLRRQLRKAIVDHVSDSFLEANVPLVVLIDAARAGDAGELEAYAAVFDEHARKLVEVAHLACSISSTNKDGLKMVRYAAAQIEALYPQVINAARLLCARPKSQVTLENMHAFQHAWQNQVQILTDAVDDITTLDDFLGVSVSHILEDVNKCVVAATLDMDAELLDRAAGAIRGRCVRMCAVVSAEIDENRQNVDYEYVQEVAGAVKRLRGVALERFSQQVEIVMQKLLNDADDAEEPGAAAAAAVVAGINENDFVDSCRAVYDAARELRQTVLLNRSPEEVAAALADDDDDNYDDEEIPVATETSQPDGYYYGYQGELPPMSAEQVFDREESVYSPTHESVITTTTSADHVAAAADAVDFNELIRSDQQQILMRRLPREERQKIAAQVETFKIEKTKFDREISRWDDTGNDVIILAKQMCMIMMEMTDFTRGRGPLKTTQHVIGAAQRISAKGKNLNELARLIAAQCPESSTKQDLLAYLDKITLFCHQLEITSKVKADVYQTNIAGAGEQSIRISALEAATSLITAAKNLMNAVVMTVKASFVASTKYSHRKFITNAAGAKAADMLPSMLSNSRMKDAPGVMSMLAASPTPPPPPANNEYNFLGAASSGAGTTPPPVVVWKMRAPDKKPLINKKEGEASAAAARQRAVGGVVEHGSLRKPPAPMRELADFVGGGVLGAEEDEFIARYN